MDDISLRAKELTGVSAPNQKAGSAISSLGALPASFKDLIHKAGARLGTGITNILADRAGIASVKERSEPTFSARDYDYERPDDYQRIDDRGSSPERGADRDDAPRTDRNDDYGREQTADSGEDRGGERADDSAESRPADQGEDYSPNEDSPKDGGEDDSADIGANSEQGEDEGDEPAGDEQTAEVKDGQSGEEGKASGADTAASRVAAGARNAGQVLSGMIESIQISALPGQAADQAGANAQVAAQRESALEGLSTAISAVGKKGSAEAAASGRSASNGTDQQAKGDAGQNANVQAQANANANSAVQAGVKAQAATAAGTASQQQAADLSRAVGDGNRVSVNVNVSNESATLVSKPSASLLANSSTSNEGGSSAQNGQNPALAQGMNQAANQAASGAKQGQAQQTNAQVSQAQLANAAASQAKGPAQIASLANTGAQQGQTGGNEAQASSAPGTTGETTQTQQNAAAKAANPLRPNLPGKAVVDQVSVQITKAIKSGADKINIQLRPASLGRVDVHLEISTDGKVAAVIIADNRDTLDLLQREAKLLEQALHDAGLHADSESLNYSLRGENQSAEGEDDGPSGHGGEAELAEEVAQDSTLASGYQGGIISDSRIDIRA